MHCFIANSMQEVDVMTSCPATSGSPAPHSQLGVALGMGLWQAGLKIMLLLECSRMLSLLCLSLEGSRAPRLLCSAHARTHTSPESL